jgi:hypothetical protein
LNGRFTDAHRASGIGSVADLPVQVCEHRPESQHHRRRHVDAELWQVALDESIDRLTAPDECVGITGGKKRRRKPTAQPEPGAIRWLDLGNVEWRDLDDLDPAQQ